MLNYKFSFVHLINSAKPSNFRIHKLNIAPVQKGNQQTHIFAAIYTLCFIHYSNIGDK